MRISAVRIIGRADSRDRHCHHPLCPWGSSCYWIVNLVTRLLGFNLLAGFAVAVVGC